MTDVSEETIFCRPHDMEIYFRRKSSMLSSPYDI